MARILITSGPTRQYLDPVRYLTNGSSGRMGLALANSALRRGHQVVIISGPVDVDYPAQAEVIGVISTDEMLQAARERFSDCQGLIGVAAPCDYRPIQVQRQKISKTGQPLVLQLIETPDVVATLGTSKRPDQWIVGFALETQDHRSRALRKLEQKRCDLMVINSPQAINAADAQIEILDRRGTVIQSITGSKAVVADGIVDTIQQRLIQAAHSQQTTSLDEPRE